MTRRTTLILTSATALAACSSAPTRFWTIEPVSAIAPPPVRAIAPVQVGTVHVPLAIDRLEIVQHDTADRITVNDLDRWSAPLGSLVRNTLTQDLIQRLPGGSVAFPDMPTPKGARVVTVELLDLVQTTDGFAMTVSWAVSGGPPHAMRLSAPAGAGDVPAQTRAIGTMVGTLSDSIAAAMLAG